MKKKQKAGTTTIEEKLIEIKGAENLPKWFTDVTGGKRSITLPYWVDKVSDGEEEV